MSTSDKYIKKQEQEFFDNVSKRIPVCIVVDCSGSMKEKDGGSTSRIDRVNEGIELFYQEVLKDPRAKDAVDVLMIAVGNEASIIQDFGSLSPERPKFHFLQEKNNLTEGVRLALQKLDERKKAYKEAGIEYYQPWLLVMSDGHVNPEFKQNGAFSNVQEEVKTRENNGKLLVLPVFVQKKPSQDSSGAWHPMNPDTYEKRKRCMGGFSNAPSRPIEINKMSGNPFEGIFKYLHRSVSSVASGRGLIQDERFGNFYKTPGDPAKPKSAGTPAYHYVEKSFPPRTLIRKKPLDSPEEQALKEEKKDKTEDKPMEKETLDDKIMQEAKKTPISLLINESPSFPPKTFDGNKTLMEVRLASGDRVAFLKDEEKRIYDEIYHDGGIYSFVIEGEDVDVKKIASDASEREEHGSEDLNEEFTQAIESNVDWDTI